MEDEVTEIVADAIQRAIRTLDGQTGLLRVYSTFPDSSTSLVRVKFKNRERTFKCVFSEVTGE